MMDILKSDKIIYKLFAITLSIMTPIILLSFYGYSESISSYWKTEFRPLFIFTNAVTSSYLFSNPKWKIPSSLLLLLTCFSVDDYLFIHNVLAVAFFITSFLTILINKRYSFYAIPYLCSLFWLKIPDILVAEIIAVYILSLFHLSELLHFVIINNKRKKIKKES